MPRNNNMMGHNKNFDIPKEMGAWVLNDPDNINIVKKPVPQPKKKAKFYLKLMQLQFVQLT